MLSTKGIPVTTPNGGLGLIINGKEYQLDDQFISSNVELLQQYPNSVIGAVIDDQCLVIGLFYEMENMQPWIFIIDLETGRRLAMYIVRNKDLRSNDHDHGSYQGMQLIAGTAACPT